MDPELLFALEKIAKPFVEEAKPTGGVDVSKSLWQKPGRGVGLGSELMPGAVDVRYLRFLVEMLYRLAKLTGKAHYHAIANAQVRFVAEGVKEQTPTWCLGNALEMIGVYHAYNERDERLLAAGRRILDWARQRKVRVTTADGVTFEHFPCGYGEGETIRDAGWTNDLSMFGSGLVWMYELLGDERILAEAVSFAEYFVQPWRPQALRDGYWHCGTWREDLGSWVVGPMHYKGFESTDLYADETSWVFSTLTCIDYLMRLYQHKRDPRYLDRCVKAARWTFEQCQFEDGGVGLCGRDDKWLGCTGDAVRQVAMLRPELDERSEDWHWLLARARLSYTYLCGHIKTASLEEHGVEWVHRTTLADPLVNVAALWLSAVLGVLDGQELFGDV